MGSIFRFICPHCNYSADVSGGLDGGMIAMTRTMTCVDCMELVDVLVGQCGKIGPSGNPDYDMDLDICPKCKGHNIYRWPIYHPCPRCHEYMTKDDQLLILWD